MSAELYSIGRVCDALAGIRTFIFTDMTNVALYGPGFLPPAPNAPPSFYDDDLLYSISMDRYSGEVTRESASDQGGDYARHRAQLYVPRSRSEVDVLLQRWRNRLLCVIGIDRYGSQHILYEATASWRHSTGTRPGTRHGYEITFTAMSHYILPPMAGQGEITTAPPVGGGSGGGSGDDACCITIQPTGIAYTPAPTGNASNLNELVTTQDGAVYFIDSSGRSILLNRPAPVYMDYQVGELSLGWVPIPEEFPLPDPDDYPSPTYDTQAEISRRFFVKNGSRWLAYDHPQGYYIDYAARRVYFETPIAGAYIEFYYYPRITPIPL